MTKHGDIDHTGLTGVPAITDAGDVPITDAGTYFTGTDVEAALQELGAAGGGSVAADAIWDAAGDLAVGSGANTAAKLTIGTSGYVLTSNGTTAAWAAASGGASDPVTDLFGAADTAYEFSTSSLTGLTALSPTPDTENADTTVPDHLYLSDNTASDAWCGRYIASPTMPFTVIIKVSDHTVRANYNAVGVFVGETTPGKLTVFGVYAAGLKSVKYTNPTTFSADLTSAASSVGFKYFGIVANSSTDIDLWASREGYVWAKHADAANPALTIASVGLAMSANNSGGLSVSFDYLRVWNSAVTFP